MTLLTFWGKYGKVSECLRQTWYFFFLFSFNFGNKQQDIMLISQHFIIIQSDQDLCPLEINESYRIRLWEYTG